MSAEIETQADRAIDVKSPRTGEILYSIHEPADDAIAAVYAKARAAQAVIAAMTVAERVAEIGKLRRYILANKERLIDRIVGETGKSRTDALISEIFNTVDAIQYYEKNAEKILAPQPVPTPLVLTPKKSRIYFEPIGPVLIISPWNYPFNLTMIPFVCAFAAGNAVVFKPSEYTPLQGMLEKMIADSGFMADALQVVYGGKETGRRLIDGRPAKVFFTGSCRGGKEVMKQAAEYLIPVELELGGKDPMVVFEDVHISRAANGALWGGMSNCGQTCTAVERILVHESIHDDFVGALKEKIEKLRTVSRGAEYPDPRSLDVGVMTTDFQVEKVQALVADAASHGATIAAGGKRIGDTHEFEPTVVTNVTPEMAIVREETFGPVITVQKFATEDEAVALANATEFGLSSSVWSADLDRAERVARRIEAGNVCINNVLSTQANAALPFGGVKQSGFGRYKGPYGLYSFSNVKSVMIDKHQRGAELNWYPYSEEKYQLFSQLIDAVYGGGSFALLKAMAIGGKLKKLSRAKRL